MSNMRIVYKEWGTYIAHREIEIDIKKVNEFLKENYYFDNVRDVTENDIEDCCQHIESGYLCQVVNERSDRHSGWTIYDLLTDYIYDEKYGDGYKWEIVDIDDEDDEFDYAE